MYMLLNQYNKNYQMNKYIIEKEGLHIRFINYIIIKQVQCVLFMLENIVYTLNEIVNILLHE